MVPGKVMILTFFLLLTHSIDLSAQQAILPSFKTYASSVFSIDINSIAGSFNDSVSCTIPFTRAGNLILVQAKAGEVEGNFILDTGAPYLILNITYFRNSKLLSTPTTDPGGITGSLHRADRTMVDSFRLDAMTYDRIEADLVNLGHIENNKGVRILGLLGMQLFRDCEMIIDYEKNLLYLHRLARREFKTYRSKQLEDTSLYRTVPITLKEDKILVTGEMAGKKLTFLIDSGAESNVLDSRLPNKIFEQVMVTGRVMLNGAGTKRVEALQGNIKNLSIGRQAMQSLPVLITNLEKMCFSYDECLDGMLGFDFLSLRKIGFNFVKREMYLWK